MKFSTNSCRNDNLFYFCAPIKQHRISQFGPIDWNVYENGDVTEMNIMSTKENKAERRSKKNKIDWTTKKVM